MGSRICEICGRRPARYVCQECGREVCEQCLEPQTWLCLECYRQIEREVPKSEERLPFQISFMKLILLGFFSMFIGMIILMIAAVIYGIPGNFGFFLLIGLIPIVFGAGEYPLWAILLAVTLVILNIVLFLILRRQRQMALHEQK